MVPIPCRMVMEIYCGATVSISNHMRSCMIMYNLAQFMMVVVPSTSSHFSLELHKTLCSDMQFTLAALRRAFL